jgi:predicted transcriptional regulator
MAKNNKTSNNGTMMRVSYYAREKLRELAKKDKRTMKSVLELALECYEKRLNSTTGSN